MKALAVICYIIGACLLVVSCFSTGVAITWWLGGAAVILLILGCIFLFNQKKRDVNNLISTGHNTRMHT